MSDLGPDETSCLDLVFDEDGLIPAIVTAADTKQILMFAFMNREAFDLSQKTGELYLYSRSRQTLWKKGGTSGETFHITRILTDCDQDVLQVEVQPKARGAACHTGRKSCFYREINGDHLTFIDQHKLFDPAEIYNKQG